MPIRAITFDFWRTLFRNTNGVERQQARVRALAEATALPEETVASAFKTTWAEFDRTHREDQQTLGPADALRMTLAELETTVPSDTAARLTAAFAEAVLDHGPVPIEGALDALRAAAERFPVGLISDTSVSPGASLRKLLARYGFLDYFQATAFSDEVGVAKPQRPMFEAAARGLGVHPNELLHVGDLEYTDVRGAQALGAKAALFVADNREFLPVTQADYIFHSWQDFVDVLPRLD